MGRQPQIDAVMLDQALRFLWFRPASEIERRGHDCHACVRCNTYGDHVLCDLFTIPHSGIKALGDDIGQAVVVDDFHFSRSRASHAVQYVCPEWTWPADELIHIREMSERTSVPASSLRYYEKLGLITSERETSGSQRRYSKATFYKIILITLAQSAGFNLEEIAEQLRNLPDIHPLPPKVWGPLHKLWEGRIAQRVAELKQLKINLRRCTRDASR